MLHQFRCFLVRPRCSPRVSLQYNRLDPSVSGFALRLPHAASAACHSPDPECALGLLGHEKPDAVLNWGDAYRSIRISIISPDNSSPVTGTAQVARVPVSFVSVALHPPQLLSEVSSRQPVSAVTQGRQAPEETHRIRASIPNLNCCCAARTVAVALKAVCQTLTELSGPWI